MKLILLSNAPSNAEEALKVLRKEAQFRLKPQFLATMKDLLKNGRCPPHSLINRAAQTSALKACGYEITK